MLTRLVVTGLRSYDAADVEFPDGPILVVGPNASGKTSLLEAIVLAARGRSPRATSDPDLVRFGADVLRVEATLRVADATEPTTIEVVLTRPGSEAARQGARKRIRINGVGRRAGSLADVIRVVLFGPEDMLLVSGPPGLRRGLVDDLASVLWPAYAADLATYARALAQRNSLLRAIREETADPVALRLWDRPFLDAGARIVERRLELLRELAEPLAAAHAEIAPQEAAEMRLGLRYETNAPSADGESVRAALERRLGETAEKEVWNGATLIGPHRDDLTFVLGDRELAAFGSRGQQRTAILAEKLAEIDLITARHRRPPLLLLDDVFSELDMERRSHLVRRLTALPQAFVTTTTVADLDPRLVERAVGYEVVPGDDGAGSRLRGPGPQGGIP